MPKDLDDIYKKIDSLYKDMDKQDSEILKEVKSVSKDQDKLLQDIVEVKKQVRDIGYKVDLMLEILNNFTIMIAEDDGEDDLEENYDIDDADETWVPKEDWESDEDLDG